ncbi:Protein CBG17078 [Caenorhabditis briggsae]|uniref:Protein CBG17078 n=1 Tax=Caenorhabditis briggsae TaxID=6238 RepID=A8XQF6_CAEBR|nr:Protein CBG17078 [Caenorhabditis briggsae]CAP34881.1 Protein CBG17078 [Caenorhabditis briggsae]
MTCLVCGSPKSEPHFGGNSCRACAAFFRRCFHSKKLVLGCICKRKPSNYHPCRSCRLAKCLAVGMKQENVNVTCEFVVEVFPEFQKLSSPDRQGLLHNFMLKIWNLEPIMDDVAQRKKFGKMDDEEIRNFMLPMFVGCFQKGAEIGKKDLWRLFGFYWRAYFEKLIEPLINLSLDSMEFMATIWILFFDHAYINISPSSSNLCWNIRKVILQELKNHEQEKACAAFFRRFFNSKKFVIKCTCTSKTVGSHPCRSCRVAKCFAVGMTPTS